jgi:hypothetical protein
MSGLDEQFNNVLVCPKCKEEKDFWILLNEREASKTANDSDRWIWVYNEKFKTDRDCEGQVDFIGYEGDRTLYASYLDEIFSITCCNTGNAKHRFEKEHPKFQEVLEFARKEIKNEG